MTSVSAKRPYTIAEEICHCSIHGLGIILSIAGLVILAAFSSVYGNAWTIVSTVLFGVSMIIMYTASTLYHAVPNQQAKKYLKKFDHIAIYYLIAGTYTPFLLVNLRGKLGWIVFGIIWGLAVLGTILKLGWLIIFVSKALYNHINTLGLTFLILGGLFYTFGIIFYVWKSRKYTHAIWHFMVLVGTIMHFFAVLYGCVLI